jgi:hypothetical protein
MSDPRLHNQHGQYIDMSATATPPAQSAPKSTRNRQPVSCQACRRSKLKCDRQRPCEACIRRGYRDSCLYDAAKVVPRKKRRTTANHNAQERLRNLENMVMQMARAQPKDSSKATPASSVGSAGQSYSDSHSPNERPIMVQGNAGSTHWTAILENLHELRGAIVSGDASEDGSVDQADLFDPDTLFLFSAPRPSSLEKILEALPPKAQVDRYMSIYFKASYLVLPILHQGRFQQQYEEFWRDPPKAPPLWIAILFSILVTACTVNVMNQAPTTNLEEEQARRNEFLGAAAQSLIFGNYGKPQEYVLEALILYAQTKYLAALDPSREVALLLPIIYRFAFELGYHREPDLFPHISVFDKEMRRRVWQICRQIDLLQAFQLGLPTYIPDDSFDTRTFSNLADSDFDEDSTFLPDSRPETEPTRILQFKVKCRIINAFSDALRAALSLKPLAQGRVMELDEEVRAAHRTVPSSLQIRSISSSFADNSSVIMARIDIEVLYRKVLCTLHRKAMIAGNAYSREVCRECAISILEHLIELLRELQPGGQLAHDLWLMSCYTMHDFLLAAMLLCLVVSQRRKENANLKTMHESQEIAMIREAYLATNVLSQQSKEAKRVSNVLYSMLSSLELSFSEPSAAAQQNVQQQKDQDTGAAVAFPAASMMPPVQHTFDYDPFDNLNAIPEDIDWAFLDEYYLNTSANMFLYNNTADVAPIPTR